ncbi:hypothetical protein MHM88_14585 [Epibacterium sp. MM17-32]|uniref:hypothetical protein n=1 Tax=Epibacterium sp. MM17-32 TaxID=2917734 RepID=UPI001EF4A664|nr:hypothetical protein [Epibacterium sp. MM17-32]MCG7629035.1 hypothetical protein [Epibacterium sp. MM17-32]
MLASIDYSGVEMRLMGALMTEVAEAIGNARDNGFPTHEMTDRELAEDLLEKANIGEAYSVDLMEHVVKLARELRHFKVYRNYGWNSQQLLLETWDEDYARRWFEDVVEDDEPGLFELAWFAECGEYHVVLSHGEAPD